MTLAAPVTTIRPSELKEVADILLAEARITLSESKATLVQSRLARRMRACQIDLLPDYLERVRADGAERAEMVTALTTNHTHFFREPHHFDHVASQALPLLKARADSGEAVRIWSAGSSSGEEIYTLLMVLAGDSRASRHWIDRGDVKLLATDLSPPMVEAVRRARYAAEVADTIPAPYREAWTRIEGDAMHIDPGLTRHVTALPLNLFGDWPMRGQFDMIFCRNVMIYFNQASQEELLVRFTERLRPGGFLYIGHSERVSGPAAAALEACGKTVYRRKGG